MSSSVEFGQFVLYLWGQMFKKLQTCTTKLKCIQSNGGTKITDKLMRQIITVQYSYLHQGRE